MSRKTTAQVWREIVWLVGVAYVRDVRAALTLPEPREPKSALDNFWNRPEMAQQKRRRLLWLVLAVAVPLSLYVNLRTPYEGLGIGRGEVQILLGDKPPN